MGHETNRTSGEANRGYRLTPMREGHSDEDRQDYGNVCSSGQRRSNSLSQPRAKRRDCSAEPGRRWVPAIIGLDLNNLSCGNDGMADTVEARRNGDILELVVNGKATRSSANSFVTGD